MSDVATWVLSYDIADDRRRARLAAYLERSGQRVQRSVFEILASATELDRVVRDATAQDRFDPGQDSLRIYRLCPTCRAQARPVGVGPEVSVAGRAVVL